MHYLSSVYFVNQHLHVSGIFVAHHQEVYCIYVEIKFQLDATEVFIADLIACSTCFGNHYAHHQELKSIIQCCCLWYFVLWFSSCWSGVANNILQTGHITLSSTPDQQLENHSTKYHRQQHCIILLSS